MTNFVSIAEAQQAKKGNIVATVINIGELKAGSKDGKDWTRKDITLQDTSGTQVLTAWNDDIQKFELNKTYEITSPFWKEYEGKPQLSLGKYANLKQVEVDTQPTTDENQNKLEGTILPATQIPGDDNVTEKQLLEAILHNVVDCRNFLEILARKAEAKQ